MAVVCGFDLEKGPRQLMRTGITLIFVGHINFILGAIVHGTVLRHVANPEKRVTSEYTTANIISVISGLLSIAAGICAILVSRNLPSGRMGPLMWVLIAGGAMVLVSSPSYVIGESRRIPISFMLCVEMHAAIVDNMQHWVLLVLSLMNSLVSAACFCGLVLAISLTVADGGRNLIAGCNSTVVPADKRSIITSNDCPFDTTRIYDTTLALWFPSMFLSAIEAALSTRCCVVAFILRGIGPCGQNYIRDRAPRPGISLHWRANMKMSSPAISVCFVLYGALR